ncbi:hypothetical protein [Streptosporangium sp. NPDC051022]|uniref:hypothetical protein n=1 Tax=Streptosporangium sp. NPDC051022 TaxID=3155752 RepID=UPI0034379870
MTALGWRAAATVRRRYGGSAVEHEMMEFLCRMDGRDVHVLIEKDSLPRPAEFPSRWSR